MTSNLAGRFTEERDLHDVATRTGSRDRQKASQAIDWIGDSRAVGPTEITTAKGIMKSPVTLFLLALLSATAFAAMADADEGMWTFDKLPLERLAADHNFTPPPGWSDHLRNSAVRLAQGCSGSFVSSKGLVLSNHHCVRACLLGLSTPGHALIELGFLAATAADEKKCPDLEVDQLVDITHISGQIKAATAGHEGPAFRQAEGTAIATVEKRCTTGDSVRCEVVTLFQFCEFLFKIHRGRIIAGWQGSGIYRAD